MLTYLACTKQSKLAPVRAGSGNGARAPAATFAEKQRAKLAEEARMAAAAEEEEEEERLEEEEQLLEAFSSISNIERAWCRATPTGQWMGQRTEKGKGGLDVMVAMSQRNVGANSTRKYVSTAHIPEPQGDLSYFHWAPFPLELSKVALVAPSPSGARLLIVRNPEPGGIDSPPPPVKLEIWGAGRLLKEVAVAPSLHGPVFADGWFEGVSWSGDESQIVYVAEEPPKARPVFGRNRNAPTPAPGGKKQPDDAGTWKGRGEWLEDWGETYTGKGRPLLYVLDIARGVVAAVEGIPADVSAGQVIWAPIPPSKVLTLVFVGWPAYASNFGTHKRLGMVFCHNRPCALYAAAAPTFDTAGQKRGDAVKLTGAISSALHPRFSPDGVLLVFLSAHAAVDLGAHAATNSLHSVAWPQQGVVGAQLPVAAPLDQQQQQQHPSSSSSAATVESLDLAVQTIIDVVPRAEEVGGFPGLYCSALIAQPWLGDARTLLLTTAWRSTRAIIAVHVETGRVSRLTPEGPISWSLLDVRNNVVVAGGCRPLPALPALQAARLEDGQGLICMHIRLGWQLKELTVDAGLGAAGASTPACPTKLMLGRINTGWLKAEGWLWSEISPPHVEYAEQVEAALKSTEFEVFQIPVVSRGAPLSEGAKQPFEAIFVRRQLAPGKAGEVPPLLVVPHGGPHSVTSTNFLMPYAYLCALGYSILHVNFRGSLGFGEEALQSLPRNIGRQDVADVLAAVDKAIAMGYADTNRVAVVGGSHGGFIACHLIGQAPDRFQTAVLRNPVTNLAGMVGTSDIPDWCFVETAGPAGVTAYSDAPSATEMQAFFRISPIIHVAKVKVPTLFLLGEKDRRVPISNALQYVQALRAQGLESKVVMFPEDNHGISKPQSEFENWLTVASWLKTHFAL
eukprot:jgi/Mesen1/850/ME000112S11000